MLKHLVLVFGEVIETLGHEAQLKVEDLVLLPSRPLFLDPPMPQYLPPCAMLSYLPLGTL